jgi:hypothetical protein
MRRVLPWLLAAVGAGLTPAAVAAADTGAWRVVSFHRDIEALDRAALDVAGADEVAPYGRRSYVAWLDSAAVRLVGRRASVRSVRVLAPAAKLGRMAAGARRAVVVRYAHGRRLATVVSLGRGLRRESIARRRDVLHVGPAATGFWFEDEGTAQMVAGNAPQGAPEPGYRDFLSGLRLDGTGVRIAIVDTGVDETHPDLEDRVVERVDYQPRIPVEGVELHEDLEGHGTHVAGIVAGAGAALGGEAKDVRGLLYGLGVAPRAHLVNQNGITSLAPANRETLPLLAFHAVSKHAVAWNASWHTGEGAGAGYLENSRILDALVRDADVTRPGAQPLTMVFSAGNEGPRGSTITSPKEAKNIITVASSQSHRVLGGSPDDISTFSSRGPAKDDRILPTVTAPGEAVMSARGRPAGGLCFEPATDGVSPYHSSCSGTSMAAPHVSGVVAVATQWWRNGNGGADPSPAMLKALLVNTAQDLGQADIPSAAEGWGRVNLGAIVRPDGPPRVHVDQTELLTDPGEQRAVRVAPADASKPLRVSLAWTDAPGSPRPPRTDPSKPDPPALVNDLDLTVTGADGSIWRGNRFDEGRAVPGGDADRLNNLENVFVNPSAPTYDVAVSAAALPGDGMPFAGDTTDQDDALVISNAVAVPAAAPRLKVQARWSPAGRGTRLRSLVISDVPAGAAVELRCTGLGCPATVVHQAFPRAERSVRLTAPFGTARLPRGAVVQLRLTVPGGASAVRRWTMRAPGRPASRRG